MSLTCGRRRSELRFRPMESVNFALAEVSMMHCMDSARRIRTKEIDVESWVGPQQNFPILNNMIASGSCGNCGSH